MKTISTYLEISSYFVIGFSILEFLLVWASGSKARDKRDTLANLSIWALNRPLLHLFTGGMFLLLLEPMSRFIPWKLPLNGWTIALTMLLTDFIYYWNHRFDHEIRMLWTTHSVHHSSQQYNLSTAVRLPWLGIFTAVPFYIPAVIFGFDPLLLYIGKSLVLLLQYWIHTESIGKLGWFDHYFNSPSNHRVHHGSNPIYLDKNHGGVLMIWDRMFGTYQAELSDTPVVYGLTKPLKSYNPFVINFHDFGTLFRDIRRAPSLRVALQYALKHPGWQPLDTIKKC